MTDTPIKSMAPNADDRALHTDITALIKRHLTPDTQERVLAVAAQVVGQVIAMQDQRKMTRAMVMDLVLANIEAGNRQVIDSLLNAKGPKQ